MFATSALTVSRCVRFLVMVAVVAGSAAVAEAGWKLNDTEYGSYGQYATGPYSNGRFEMSVYVQTMSMTGVTTHLSYTAPYNQLGPDVYYYGVGIMRTFESNFLYLPAANSNVSNVYGVVMFIPDDGGFPAYSRTVQATFVP